MNRIVDSGLKIDFHIHSYFSHYKDPKIVKEGTIRNLSLLISKLQENQINMAAITDHDVFSYEMYKSFKSYENSGSIKKVLPGVEFSVGFFDDNNKQKQVHVIAIFNDNDEGKLKKLQEILNPAKKPNYQNGDNSFFSESRFRDLLKDIDLDVLLIAHQKNSPSSTSPRPKDANSVGPQKFNEFINCAYFDAYEFKSMKEGLFCNLFKINQNRDREKLRFITGSDCHQWELYPKHDSNEKEMDYEWTYLKCLPTFKGLKLALTDDSRINTINNFFNGTNDSYVKSLELSIDSQNISVPLSKGLNVIIGDNSIGKSMLVHAFTNFVKWSVKDPLGLSLELKQAYVNVLHKNKIKINNPLNRNDIYEFDSQGEIRSRFNTGNNFKNDFINDKYPPKIDSNGIKEQINDQFQHLYDRLKKKFSYDSNLAALEKIKLLNDFDKVKNLSVKELTKSYINNISSKITSLGKLIEKIALIINEYKKLLTMGLLDQEDQVALTRNINELENLKIKYTKRKDILIRKDRFINPIKIGVTKFNEKVKATKSSQEDQIEKRNQSFSRTSDNISYLLKLKKQLIPKFEFNLGKIQLPFNCKDFGEYKFIERFKIRKDYIDNDYLFSILKDVFIQKADCSLDKITCLSKDELAKNIKITTGNVEKDKETISLLKDKIDSKINDDFSNEKVILRKNMDFTTRMSDGFNSTAYFDLISYDKKPGIYIVDQPEDDVSQPKIKSNVINDIKRMALDRQVILITHNPLFVINIDADNVIFLTKKDNNLVIKSGALEYECTDYDILQIVADNLDGGIESIEKRWKRYEKDNLSK